MLTRLLRSKTKGKEKIVTIMENKLYENWMEYWYGKNIGNCGKVSGGM